MSPPVDTKLSSPLKNIIKELAKKYDLNELRNLMENRHGFKATKAQYERILRDLGIQKKHSSEDWKVLDMKLKVRKRKGRESDIYDHGRLMDPKRVRKEISRNPMTFMEELHLASAPSPKTPPCFEIYTPKGPPISRSLFRNLPILKYQEVLFAESMSNSGSAIETGGAVVQQIFKRSMMLEGGSPSLAVIEALLPNSALLDEDSACFLALKSPENSNTSILLNLVIYITSNSFPGESTPNIIYNVIREQGNTAILDALLAREDLTAKAAVEKLFRCAVEAGDVPVVKRFLDAGLDPNDHVCAIEHIPDQLTPMQYACMTRNTAMVQALIKGKSKIDAPGSGWKSSALVLAISAAYHESNDKIHFHKHNRICDCDSDDNLNGAEGLDHAASDYDSQGDFADLEDFAVECQCAVTNLGNLVLILLDAGADINLPSQLYSTNQLQYVGDERFEDWLSPLATASKFRQNVIVSILIEKGAMVNFVPPQDRSALQECLIECKDQNLAAYRGSIFQVDAWFDTASAIVQNLLGAKADPNYGLNDWERPLSLAASSHKMNITELLLSAGARVTQISIFAAADSGNLAALDLLLSTGFEVDRETGKYIILKSRLKGDWYTPVKMALDLHPDFELCKFAALSAIKSGSVTLWNFLIKDKKYEVVDLIENNPGIKSAIEKCCLHGKTEVLCLILHHASLFGFPVSHLLGSALQHTMQMEDRSKIPNLVDLLLVAGADVNVVGCSNDQYHLVDRCFLDNEPALFYAIRNREEDIVDKFIKAGADVFLTTGHKSALHLAVEGQSTALVKRLLDAGAHVGTSVNCFHCSLEFHSTSGHTLYSAIKYGGMPIVMALIEKGANINKPGSAKGARGFEALDLYPARLTHTCEMPLTTAIRYGRWECAEYLILQGATVDNPMEILMGRTSLSAAIVSGNQSMIRRLLDAGAHPGHPRVLEAALPDFTLFQDLIWRLESSHTVPPRANLGGLALMTAINKRFHEAANLILKKKLVDVNFQPNQHIGLHEAIYPQHRAWHQVLHDSEPQILRWLSQPHDLTQLQNAMHQRDMVMIAMLLKSGANPDATSDSSRDTPLQHAADCGHSQDVDILIEYGANINSPPKEPHGRTALQHAAKKGYLGIAFKLIESGADVNASGSERGGAALELAAWEGRLDMVQMLLNAGAEIHGDGEVQYQRAVELATYNRHHVVRKLLEEYHG